jgi:hypothetical protein
MNRTDAKKIAETITNEELSEMFENAKANITDWTKVSNVNKGMSKGAAWNILASDFNIDMKYHNMARVNMVREFGEFLPNHLKPAKKTKTTSINVVHQEPRFK